MSTQRRAVAKDPRRGHPAALSWLSWLYEESGLFISWVRYFYELVLNVQVDKKLACLNDTKIFIYMYDSFDSSQVVHLFLHLSIFILKKEFSES